MQSLVDYFVMIAVRTSGHFPAELIDLPRYSRAFLPVTRDRLGFDAPLPETVSGRVVTTVDYSSVARHKRREIRSGRGQSVV